MVRFSFRRRLFMAVPCMLLLMMLLPFTAFAHLDAASNRVPHLLTMRHADIKARGQWFRSSHFGKQQPPADSRINALAQAALLPERSGDNAWTPLGPQPLNSQSSVGLVSGRITAEAVNPANSSDVWIGAADGGVWNTLDGGNTWKSMTDKQQTLSTGSLAIDPTHPNTIYVGTGEANFSADNYWGVGVFKSTNHGATWKRYGGNIFGGLGIGKIAVDPANSKILLLSTIVDSVPGPKGQNNSPNVGIWRSTNGGINWTHVLSGTAGTDVVFDPANPSIAFAGLGTTSNIAGVYKSTDSGQTWTLLSSGIPTGSTASIFRVSLGISSDGTHVYAVLTDGANFGFLLNNSIYASTDTGTTWTAKAAIPAMTGYPFWWYATDVAADPSDATGNTAYVGGGDVFQTLDGGTTWTDLSAGIVHVDQHALAFLGKTSSSFYVGCDGGVWLGAKAGTFTDKNTGGLNITQFYGGSIGEVGAHAQLYGGSQDNGIDQDPMIPPRRPTQWNQVFDADGGEMAVDYTNNALVYGETQNVDIVKSSDGGTTWNAASAGINFGESHNFIAPLVMSPNNHNELFTATDHLYRTTDGAVSWTATGPAPDPGVAISVIAAAPGHDNVIAVGDNFGKVFVTTNGGVTWNGGSVAGSTGGMVRGLAVDPTNPKIIYASFANFATSAGHHVFRSTNGGTSWKDISISLPNIPFNSLLIFSEDGEQAILVGSDVGVFGTENRGASWARIGHGLPNVAIDQIFMNRSGKKIFVATHGRGMWELLDPDVD